MWFRVLFLLMAIYLDRTRHFWVKYSVCITGCAICLHFAWRQEIIQVMIYLWFSLTLMVYPRAYLLLFLDWFYVVYSI